ncbi:NDP-hexose 2,3-dehydratase family protein [Eshraghiella crossota]
MKEKKKNEKITNKYFWVNYSTLNMLIQVNNCINIQLRNLLSLLKL